MFVSESSVSSPHTTTIAAKKVSKKWPSCFELSVTQRVSLLPPANEVCEGYVFTGVCLSTRGDVCLWSRGVSATPLGRHPQADTPPDQTPHPTRHPTRADNPPTPSEGSDTVNKRAVRIPLECILVYGIVVVKVLMGDKKSLFGSQLHAF